MANRSLRIVLALIFVGIVSKTEGAVATLKPKTIQGWETYVQFTEKRINDELAVGRGFLLLDFKPQEERDRIRKTLKAGSVFVEKRETRDARGKEIQVDDGMVHHWYGSIFVPNVTLGTLRRWLQNYDRHADYFEEVEESRLLKRDGEDFKIFLRLFAITRSIPLSIGTILRLVFPAGVSPRELPKSPTRAPRPRRRRRPRTTVDSCGASTPTGVLKKPMGASSWSVNRSV